MLILSECPVLAGHHAEGGGDVDTTLPHIKPLNRPLGFNFCTGVLRVEGS